MDCSLQFAVRYLTLIVAGISWQCTFGKILIISLYVIIFLGRNFLMQIESPYLWLHHSDCVAFISLIWLVLCCSYCASVYSNFNIIYTQLGKSSAILLQFSCLGFVLLQAFCILCTLSCKLSICTRCHQNATVASLYLLEVGIQHISHQQLPVDACYRLQESTCKLGFAL